MNSGHNLVTQWLADAASEPWRARDVHGCLPLRGLHMLDADTAEQLAAYTHGPLLLDGLKSLSPQIAAALLTEDAPYSLSLDGLVSLDTPTADVLGNAGRDLSFDALTSINFEVAKELAKTKGRVAMPSLARVSARTYLTLVQNPRVELPPVEAITFIPEPDGSPPDMRVIREVVRLVCQREADAHMDP